MSTDTDVENGSTDLGAMLDASLIDAPVQPTDKEPDVIPVPEPDPYETLARHVAGLLNKGPEEVKVAARTALDSIRFAVTAPNDAVDQVRTFLELYCSPMPLVERLQTYLYGKYESDLRDDWKLEDILIKMGFKPQAQVQTGMAAVLHILDQASGKLEEPPPGAPAIDRQTIRGAGADVFGALEHLLEMIVSFYGRWLTLNDEPSKNSLDEWLMERKLKLPKLKLWIATHNPSYERPHMLDVSESVSIIRKFNELVTVSPYTERFQTFFGRGSIVAEELLGQVGEANSHRPEYAHGMPGRSLPEAQEDVSAVRDVVTALDKLGVLPPVYVVERRITMGDGTTRLDCRGFGGKLQAYRFAMPVRFYPGPESFLGLSHEEPSNLSAPTGRVYQRPPFILPVDLRYKGDPI